MLDTATKKRIDDCRDILVGKLPDPKAQIEQITIALIYKFMDDMDQESIELGGKAKFFMDYKIPDPEFPDDRDKDIVVPFAKYAWHKLFDTKVTATEMLSLYSAAIMGLDKNPNIPPLFRDIFKNAFLPYRDPETLKLFLKTIGEFEYTHSEKLGDAFEYLLSVMGSQGDAGQFRTPRHIIDFVVAAVDPSKTDSILDPACGTAGFLISAFKYIRGMGGIHGINDINRRDNACVVSTTLTPDERKKIMQNVVGYDISPDMVRLSLVNLYLHGFSDPHIFEYDTLSSEELVEKYLYAVVSLPAGVFNPYSGVKTSVLLMDKQLAKKKDDILFVKIDNDGFGLGAQRNEIRGSQLEEALEVLQEFKEGSFWESKMAHAVTKKEIGKNGDYNLSGERYRHSVQRESNYQLYEIGDVCKLVNGTAFKPSDWEPKENGGLPIIRIQNLNNKDADFNYYSGKVDNKFIVEPEDLLFSWSGSRGTSFGAHIWDGGKAILNQHIFNVYFDKEKAIKKYMYYVLNQVVEEVEQNLHGGVGLVHITKGNLERIKIPLPPLSIQEEIVAEIEGYQKIIDGAKAVVENYKPKIDIDPDWEMVELGELAKNLDGKRIPITQSVREKGPYPYYGASGIVDYVADFIFNESLLLISEDGANLLTRVTPIAFSVSGKVWVNNHAHVLQFDKFETQKYIETYLNSISLEPYITGSAQPKLNQKALNSIAIPLPEFEVQKEIISQIEKEQQLVDANKQLIAIFEQKIKDRIAKVWGEKKKEYVMEDEVLSMVAEDEDRL